MKKTVLIFVIFLMTGTLATAQVDLTNTGILFLSNNTDTCYINGNFANTSAAALNNNGQLYIRQGLINDQAAMAVGTGTLYLNGTALQTVSGTQIFKTHHLITNNGAGFILNNDLGISGTHSFSSGMITTAATPNYLVYEAGSDYTGLNDARHVNGWVKKTGNTDFIFPVGNANYERSVALIDLTVSGTFSARHNNGVTPYRTQVFSPLVYVDSAEYWTINKLSGGSAKVTMNWNSAKVVFPLLMMSDIRAAYYNGTFWINIGGAATGDIFTTGTVTSNSISAFNNNFTIGSTSVVLPVSNIVLKATRYNSYTGINWTVSNEYNVKHYELQRSDDGITFYVITMGYPHNGNQTVAYNYEDRALLQGTAYYRLRSTAINGQQKYSAIVAVSSNVQNRDIYLVKNPVDTRIEIYAGVTSKGIYNYLISNGAGQVMQSGILDIQKEGIQFIPLRAGFAAGIYLLKMQSALYSFSQGILVK